MVWGLLRLGYEIFRLERNDHGRVEVKYVCQMKKISFHKKKGGGCATHVKAQHQLPGCCCWGRTGNEEGWDGMMRSGRYGVLLMQDCVWLAWC